MIRLIAGLLFFALFGVAAFVQRNDPDPSFWIGVYGVAALASLLFAFRLLPRVIAWTMAAAAIATGLAIWYGSWRAGIDPTPEDQFLAEEIREAGGLGMIGLWMLVAGTIGRGQRRPSE